MQIYPAKYIDNNGEVETTIRNDYKTLRMNLRGVEFSGESFTGLDTKGTDSSALANFTFAQECLCDCKISYEMPIDIIAENNLILGNLAVQIELGKPNEKGWSERDDVILVLSYDDKTFRSNGTSEWFEDELLDIQNQLPANHKLKCCFGCIYSDYSVYGHGFFGDLMCYRNIKEDYKQVSDKRQFMKIMENFTAYVQETYICEEFEVRKTGTGYRG